MGEVSAKAVGENAPHGSSLAFGDDTYCGAPTVAQDAPKLGEALCRVGKEHQAELAQDAIKAGIAESQRLAVGDHRSIGFGQSGAARSEHRG
jgi:hypothetical protein